MNHVSTFFNAAFWWSGALIYGFGGLSITAYTCVWLLDSAAQQLGMSANIIRAWCHLKYGMSPEERMNERDGR